MKLSVDKTADTAGAQYRQFCLATLDDGRAHKIFTKSQSMCSNRRHLIGRFFIEDSINGQKYLESLQQNILPAVLALQSSEQYSYLF